LLTEEIPQSATRIGRDGRKINTAKIGKSADTPPAEVVRPGRRRDMKGGRGGFGPTLAAVALGVPMGQSSLTPAGCCEATALGVVFRQPGRQGQGEP